MSKIGIYSGVFDPVHNGHVDFALAASKAAGLDTVYFLVEPQPRRKTNVTHLAHRVAMVKLATAGEPKLEVLDLPDKQFSVTKTMPRLKQKFPNDELYFVAGSDMLEHMPDWPYIGQMLEQVGLLIGLRSGYTKEKALKLLSDLPIKAKEAVIIDSPRPELASGKIRHGQRGTETLPAPVSDYIKANWLYVAPSKSSSSS